MRELIKTNKTYIVALAVLFVFVSLSETTYSLFLKSDTTNEFNYNTGLLDLQFIEDEQISLENAFPMNDSEGVKLQPYHLTIKNTGSLAYLFNLKMLVNEGSDAIDSKYIKVKVDNYLPHTLANADNLLVDNIIIYPNEEITFKINVWLDIDTPNDELGKKFSARVVTSGSGVYKTIDNSGANHPKTTDGMMPVYYDAGSKEWKIADESNTQSEYNWYNYNEGKWANSVVIKNSEKQIYDLTGKYNIKSDNLIINNGNLVIDEKYLDLGFSYNYSNISNVIRVKFNEINDSLYLISNGNLTYYYDNNHRAFIVKSGNNSATSDPFEIEKNKWYILGYTYDGSRVSFYVNGNKIGTSNMVGNIGMASFKLGTDSNFKKVSKITIGDVLFYNRILTDNEMNSNYKGSMNIIYDSLLAGYHNFTPMTLREYYQASNKGTIVKSDDILSMFVWIPRFKYRVFNVLGEDNVDTYDAYHKGIEVTFENLTASSGVIYCEGNVCYSDSSKTTKVNSSDNGKYYTHPAFRTTTGELDGLWVSKYEITGNKESKGNSQVVTNDYLSNYYKQVKGISAVEDYHIIKNTEWGSVVYLTHSKYGLCKNNNCSDIGVNDTLVSGSVMSDSTTGNIYGVFDMAGSASEYTMGNISKNNSLNLENAHFNEMPIGTDDYDLYGKDTFILGDATKELSLGDSNWYGSSNSLSDSGNWLVRSNLYGYSSANDVRDNEITTRIVVK